MRVFDFGGAFDPKQNKKENPESQSQSQDNFYLLSFCGRGCSCRAASAAAAAVSLLLPVMLSHSLNSHRTRASFLSFLPLRKNTQAISLYYFLFLLWAAALCTFSPVPASLFRVYAACRRPCPTNTNPKRLGRVSPLLRIQKSYTSTTPRDFAQGAGKG